ncbi:MAG: CotH kinase family protein [Flavobacteriales bacterium]
MKNKLFLALGAALLLSACDTELREIIVSGEALEFKTDSTFDVEYLVSRMPIVMLETDGREILDEPRIIAKMGIVDNGKERYNGNWNKYTDFEGKVSIERRGFTSQNFPKLQYAFETIGEDSLPENVELLGFPMENDWILHAPYSDKSLIRNVLIYNWWEELGHYASRTKFCELLLNGEYRGVYILMEQIKWDKGRVDITKIDLDDNAGDSLTGGYIIKIDKPIGGDGEYDWTTSIDTFQNVKTNVSFQYDYPNDDEITDTQADYIQSYIRDLETELAGETFSEEEGFREYLDVNSFIDFFIIQELAHNVDGYRSSTYLHKKRDSEGGKLFAGPVWDFNLALGNTTGCDGEKTEGWALDHPCDPTVIPFWWKRMNQDSVYKSQLVNRWFELRKDVLSNEDLLKDIDGQVAELGHSVGRNFTRWPILGTKVWPNYFVGETHQQEIEYLKNWLLKRVTWIDQNIEKL